MSLALSLGIIPSEHGFISNCAWTYRLELLKVRLVSFPSELVLMFRLTWNYSKLTWNLQHFTIHSTKCVNPSSLGIITSELGLVFQARLDFDLGTVSKLAWIFILELFPSSLGF